MRNALRAAVVGVLLLVPAIAGCTHPQARADTSYGLGRPADPAEAVREDIDVAPDGTGLPPGRGDAVDGAAIFATSCRSCHGTGIRLDPKRWPYATTLFDYVRRAMPPNPSRRLSADGVYAVVAYELYLNGLIPQDQRVDKAALVPLKMPGVGDFIEHP